MEILGSLGAILFVIGWIWLIIIGFKQGGALWGILIILFSWMAGLVFCILKKEGGMQLAMMIIGAILAGVGLAPSIMNIFNKI